MENPFALAQKPKSNNRMAKSFQNVLELFRTFQHFPNLSARTFLLKKNLVDVSDIFYFCFCSGRGKGEFEAPGEGGVGFY